MRALLLRTASVLLWMRAIFVAGWLISLAPAQARESAPVKIDSGLIQGTSDAKVRQMPAEKILAADSRWPADAVGLVKSGTLAVRDGYVFPAAMHDTFVAGKQNDVPLLVGYNANEGAYFVDKPLKAAAYVESVQQEYGRLADRVLKLYPASSDEIAAHSQLRLLRDNWFGWHVWTWARLQATTGRGKVYFYNFSHVPNYPPGSPLAALGAAHGFELGNVFANVKLLPSTASAHDKRVLETISSYWTHFAKTGDPNGPGLPSWPIFTALDQRAMNLGDPIVAGPIASTDLDGLELQHTHAREHFSISLKP